MPSKEKLEQHTIDFEKLDASGLNAKPWDVVFITCVLSSCFGDVEFNFHHSLGTTKKDAGSAEKFVKIDRECVVSTLIRL